LEGAPLYRTEVLACESLRAFFRLSLRISRGFRHQIRCHLAWLGLPLLNDGLYGGSAGSGGIALSARLIRFPDPQSGEEREYSSEVLPWPENVR
jgi:23S rRNA pseudouridine1911/1915/1917 synthase